MAFSSGMGAITACCWTLLNPGDELIVDETIYGCTFSYFHHGLARYGVKITHVDLTRPERLAAAIGPGPVWCIAKRRPTRICVWSILPQSPKLLTANRRCCWWITPIARRICNDRWNRGRYSGALRYQIHRGHGDLLAGLVVTRQDLAQDIRLVGLKDMNGAVLSAQDAALLLRGLKTLPLRMERHCDNAQRLAEMLAQHSAVERVYYPGLEDFPSMSWRSGKWRGRAACWRLNSKAAWRRAFASSMRCV